MFTEEQISSLVLRVQEARERGEPGTVEDLCGNAPELIAEVKRRLALLAPFDAINRSEGNWQTLPPRSDASSSEALPSGRPPAAYPRGELSFLEPPQAVGELGRLGRFQILEVLGVGGMGIVFRAHDAELHREIALKVMRPEFSNHPTARPRFLQEARAMAAIKDDHVITVHDVGTLNAVPFLAMELLHGQALHHRLEQRRRLPWTEVVQIAVETARGLAAAHERGLIHRDVKPSNLWLEARPGAGPNERGERVKVLDFGLVRPIDCDRSLSPEGTLLGTPSYVAPEQTRGQVVDARADLFSLGCVLYELVTGCRAFAGQDALQILLKINDEQQTPALQLNPEMPESLSRLIDELLAKDRDQRPSSAREVISRLQAIARNPTADLPGGKGTVARSPIDSERNPSTRTYLPAGGPRRKRWGLVAAGLGVAALIVVAVWGLAAGWFRSPGDAVVKGQPVVEDTPLHGDLIVHLRKEDGTKRKGRIGLDVGADLLLLPVRENDRLQLEAKLDQKAYVYLLWVDGKGEVTPLYPWNPEGKLVHKTLAAPPPDQVPQSEVLNPMHLDYWWQADDTEGLDTMLLLARRTPLPADVSLADLMGKLPAARLGPPHELVVRGMDRGQQAEDKQRDHDRRPKGDADALEDQLLNLMDRLKDHFELIRAVQFAHARK